MILIKKIINKNIIAYNIKVQTKLSGEHQNFLYAIVMHLENSQKGLHRAASVPKIYVRLYYKHISSLTTITIWQEYYYIVYI